MPHAAATNNQTRAGATPTARRAARTDARPMQLTRAAYFADFYVYPFVVASLVALAIRAAPYHGASLALAFLVGLGAWTLLEYLVHRWVFHRAPWIRRQHEAHHDDPKALVGTPTWLSLVVYLALVLLPSVLAAGLALGSSFTAGLLLGYLWYAAAHYGSHYWHPGPRTYLSSIKRRHALHHHVDCHGNFGVTTPLWDHVFRTQIGIRGENDPLESAG
jgi:sterol desaturase/sphingolipid hydroxylase (fatty acid hydroxylase superfamily)